ncbi:Signal recognition particle receptor subunit beta [Brachionus plicatilis]|uniref:Signal recognition particle receptor subunit beta n=1 Tax=Brachionus plicatilis TaxID=10195 RepID=A0A3M7S7Z8_BRAPC|nr:Signal recognition particle receptor subunit beta [Brachionus plicatilis]
MFERIFEDKSTLGISIAVLVVVITLLIIWLLKRSKDVKKNFLLVGASNSGKTRLLCQLLYKKNLLTQISFNGKKKLVSLIDIPGQDKVRRKFFTLYKKTAKALVFVVDSSTFQKEIKDVAQFLYEILTDDLLAKSKMRLLIICNKQDIDLSKGQAYIKSNLEKEIELLRKISGSALKSTGSSGDSKMNFDSLIKNINKQFEFTDLKYFKVEFCETSSLEEEKMSYLKNWLIMN